MPKQKTRRAAAKRFRITKKGKVMRNYANRRHLLECKSAKKMRQTKRGGQVAKADIARVKAMLPGG